MTDAKFDIGDRVKLNPQNAGRYRAAWRRRVERGLCGTVVAKTHGSSPCYDVRFDMPKNAKYVHDWFWPCVRASDLILEPTP